MFIFLTILQKVLAIKEKMELQFGGLIQKVTVEIDDELPINTIAVSECILKPFNIPTNLPYEVIIEKDKMKDRSGYRNHWFQLLDSLIIWNR